VAKVFTLTLGQRRPSSSLSYDHVAMCLVELTLIMSLLFKLLFSLVVAQFSRSLQQLPCVHCLLPSRIPWIMASRLICPRNGIVVFAVGFSLYLFMKYYLISVADSDRERWQTTVPVPITTINGSFEAVFGNKSCRVDVLGAPAFVRAAGCNNGECDTITCQRLLVGDDKAIAAATQFTNEHQRRVMTETELLKKTSDCKTFRKNGGYVAAPLRPSDSEFPIAFSILIHWHLEQFERLLRAIYRPQNVYCIHVDAKTSWEFHSAVVRIAHCLDNVYVASRRQRVVYAGFSRLQVRSYLVLLKVLLR